MSNRTETGFIRPIGLCLSVMTVFFSYAQKVVKQDSISLKNPFKFFSEPNKNLKIKSNLSYDFRYYGLQYEGMAIQPFSQNLYIHNTITLYRLPFDVDINYGNGYLQAQRKYPLISVKFNAAQMRQDLSETLIKEEHDRLKQQLESDTNFVKYQSAVEQLSRLNDLLNNKSYLDQVSASKKILQSAGEIPDSLRSGHNQLLADASSEVSKYDGSIKLLDSLNQYKTGLEKSNPLYKQYQGKDLNVPEGLDDDPLGTLLSRSAGMPSMLKYASYVKKLDVGVVYPANNPLLFDGAAIKGLSTIVEKKHSFIELVVGKQLITGDFFRDTFAVSKNQVIYLAGGYKSKYIKVGLNMYSYEDKNLKDTSIFKYSFFVPNKTLIPGLIIETRNTKCSTYLRVSYVIEDVQSKAERYESRIINSPSDDFENKSSLKNMSLQTGLEMPTFKKGPKIVLSYRWGGKDFYSPSAPFTAPFNELAELKLEQKLFKGMGTISGGALYRKNLSSFNTQNLNDRTLNGFVAASLKVKKLPFVALRYTPIYRRSIWQGEIRDLQINQWSASMNYNKQIRKQLYVIAGNYLRQEINFNGIKQVNQIGYLFSMFKPRRYPLQFSATGSYFDKPVSLTSDSSNTLGLKIQGTYLRSQNFSVSLYADYSQNPILTRRIVGSECYIMTKAIGNLQFRMEYGLFRKSTGSENKGINISLTYSRKLL